MMRILVALILATAGVAMAEDDHAGASFKEGVGVIVGEETRASIGLEIADVEEREVTADVMVTAQVYREAREPSQNEGEPAGFAYASAWVDIPVAKSLPAGAMLAVAGHPEAQGRVIRVDPTAAADGGRLELLLQLRDDDHPWRIGEFVRVAPRAGAGELATIVPKSAVLETAYGPFAYVVNGRAFLRTAVEIGARHSDTIEITDGLYSGDQVVVRPVETLYLIELRATKGGGHSH